MESRKHDSGHSLRETPSDCEEVVTVRFLLETCFYIRDERVLPQFDLVLSFIERPLLVVPLLLKFIDPLLSG